MIKYLAIILLLVVQGAGAATKYISPTGSALWAACTTDATPCALSTALTSAAGGDIIYMADGSYGGFNTATNGSSGNYIEWRSTNSLGAVIDGLTSTDKTLVIDNNYHRFVGIKIAVPSGPGAANVYGLFATGTAWEFLDGEITYEGDEGVTGSSNIIYCAQLRSAGVFDGNYVHNCTYGVNVFSSSAGFAATVTNNIFEDMLVGDHEDSDCMAVSGAASYDWTGTVFSGNSCKGWRDDGIDLSSQDNVIVQDNQFYTPAADPEDTNSSCIKVGYEGSTGNIVRRNRCLDLNGDVQDNYGLIMTGTSSALVESNIIAEAYEGATIAERNAAGGDDNILRNNIIIAIVDDGIQVGTGSTGTVLQNNILSSGTRDINVLTGITATGANNRRVNGTGNGDGTYNQTGDTDGDAEFIGGTNPTTVYGFISLSEEICTGGVNIPQQKDYYEIPFKNAIGAIECGSIIRFDTTSIRNN